MGRTLVENRVAGIRLGGQQQSHYTVLKCLNYTCLKNDRKPLKDLSLFLGVVIVF